MRNPAKPLLSCLVSLLCLMSVSAADLKTYSDVYQKNSEEIRQGYQPKFDGIQLQYQKSLETLKMCAQGKGDFKTTKAAFAEIERFQKAKTLPPAPDESEIPEIKAFQAAYVKQYAKLETELTADMGAMTAKYGQALDRLLKGLTKAGKMEEAAAVEAALAKAQSAVKDFSEQLAVLKGPAATSAAPAAAEAKTEKDARPEVGGASGTKKSSSKKASPKNVVVNGDFEKVVDGKPEGWENTKMLTLVTEKGNTFAHFDIKPSKDGRGQGCETYQINIEVPAKVEQVRVSVRIRTEITPDRYGGPSVWVQFYDKTESRLKTTVAKWGGKNGSWKDIQKEEAIPDGAVIAKVSIFANNAVGQMDFDDIEVTFK